MDLEPIKKQKISDLIVEKIKDYIFKNKSEFGSRMPSERKLVELLQVSRTALREALKALEIMGYISTKAGRGIFVSDPNKSNFDRLQSWLNINKEIILEHFEIRLLVEQHIAERASKVATQKDLEQLRKNLNSFKEAVKVKDMGKMIHYDTQFHLLLAKITGNRTLHTLMKVFTTSLIEGWQASLRVPSRPEKTIDEHTAIYNAIKTHKNQEARDLVKEHLEGALEDIKKIGFKPFKT